jgi:uncharacterized protein (DUF2249 family)
MSPADAAASETRHWVGSRRLADEHAVLLHEVRLRRRAVRAVLGAGRWPEHEIGRLVAYLRFEVLDQTTHEESLLFPLVEGGLAATRVRRLAAEHARLRDLADTLAIVGAAAGPRRAPQTLVDLLEDLDALLVQHMQAEQAVLAAATTDGVESRRHPFRCHLWFPMTEGSTVDLRDLPREFAHRAALERFSRMRPGERLVLTSGDELDSLWNVLAWGHPGEFGWTCLENGPERWRVEVTRRLEN